MPRLTMSAVRLEAQPTTACCIAHNMAADRPFPGSAKFTAGSGCTGLYRGLKLWEPAVKKRQARSTKKMSSGH